MDNTNIDIELHPIYVGDRIIGSLNQPLPQSATQQQLNIPPGQPGYIPKNGATITAPSPGLLQEIAGPPKQNILNLLLTPWVITEDPKPDGTVALSKAPLGYSFNLLLFLVPHLITPQTVPDLSRRQSLLQCGSAPDCSGVLLSVDLDKLTLGSGPIFCTTNPPTQSPGYDFIQQQVLQGVYDQLYGTPNSPPLSPIVLPSKPVTDFVSGLLGNNTRVNLTGVALGSDENLKLGLALDQGIAHPFQSSLFLLTNYFQGNDWGIDIDRGLVSTAIQSQALTAANGQDVTLNVPINTDYQRAAGEGVLSVSATGHLSNRTCVPVSVSDTICLKVCKNAGNQSTLMSYPQPPNVTSGTNLCSIFYVIFGQGLSNAQICVGGPCPAITWTQLGPPIQFPAGPNDTFYATGIVTDNGFYISGRSTLEDGIQSRPDPRAACASLPPTCP